MVREKEIAAEESLETPVPPRSHSRRVRKGAATGVILVISFFFANVFSFPGCSLERKIKNDLAPFHDSDSLKESLVSTVIPLHDLVQSNKSIACPENLVRINDTTRLQLLDSSAPSVRGNIRKIPRIVHMTSRSRCVTQRIASNLDSWRFSDHSFYFHDDEAVDRLFDRDWPMFPNLRDVMKCITSATAKVDIWRYLVLWEYGGIYSDIDNAPVKFNGETINGDDDAFFVVAVEGSPVISQFFMAASPHHPIMYLAIQHALNNILVSWDIGKNRPPHTTGPKAIALGFQYFLKRKDGYTATAGKFVGVKSRSITVVGDAKNPNEYVNRGALRQDEKNKAYESMNMTHFFAQRSKTGIWCLEHILNSPS